jgi:nucleotide-binding universal stress UspA family protein
MAFTKILVATDFSKESEAALDTAIGLALEGGASIRLVHVVDEPVTAAAWSEGYGLDVAGLCERLLEQAERSLTQIQASHKEVPLSTMAVIGHPARAIVEMAAEEHFDLIVVGSHGRHAISRLLLGSVADRVVRHAPCTVLTVKAPATEAESPLEHKTGTSTAA